MPLKKRKNNVIFTTKGKLQLNFDNAKINHISESVLDAPLIDTAGRQASRLNKHR